MYLRLDVILVCSVLLLSSGAVWGSPDHDNDTAHYVAGGHVWPLAGLTLPGLCNRPNEGDSMAVLVCMLQCPSDGDTCTIAVLDDEWGPFGAWSRCVDGSNGGYGANGSRTIPNECEDGSVWVWPDLAATTGTITTS